HPPQPGRGGRVDAPGHAIAPARPQRIPCTPRAVLRPDDGASAAALARPPDLLATLRAGDEGRGPGGDAHRPVFLRPRPLPRQRRLSLAPLRGSLPGPGREGQSNPALPG